MKEPFPTHFNLILDGFEHADCWELWGHDPYLLSPLELLHKVVKAGLKAMRQTMYEERKDPEHENRVQWESRHRAEEEVQGKRAGLNGSRCRSASKPDIPNYVGVPLEEPLRRRLEHAYSEHGNGIIEEEFFARLLELGLDGLEQQQVQGRRPTEATSEHMLGLAERLHARARKRCL
jgi:hypothetical protein